jgi:hypothetical protein
MCGNSLGSYCLMDFLCNCLDRDFLPMGLILGGRHTLPKDSPNLPCFV